MDARRDSDGLRVTFSFAAATPAALFRRADTVWLIFDSTKPFDVAPIREKAGAIISDVSRLPLEKGQAIRIRLNRPQMPSLEADDRSIGTNWTLTFADRGQKPPLPLMVVRNITDPQFANVSVPLANPGQLHRLVDPDAGDMLWVVTAPPPTHGLIKRQDFVELSLLESIHGLVVHPNSDDVKVEVGADKVMLGRPGGLTLSSADVAAERATAAVKPLFDAEEWRKNQEANFVARLDALIAADAAATTTLDQLSQARLDLANFYVARGMYEEAHAVSNLILSETKRGSEEAPVVMIHAVTSILMGRPDRGLKDLANPVIGNGYDSQLWKGARLCAPGQMGGCAGEIQERRILGRDPAGGPAAHRDDGFDEGLARGEGLCQRRAAQERARRHRHPQGDEARRCGAARPARRSARARKGRARRLPFCGKLARPPGGCGSQAARTDPEAEARRDHAGRNAA